MEGKRLLHSIRLTNLLSYGSEGVTLELEPLNVLIGPNASGKSNLIEAISLLAAAPRDLQKPIREGGGIENWLWKGSERFPVAMLGVIFESFFISYELTFSVTDSRFKLVDESVEFERAESDADSLIYGYGSGRSIIITRIELADGRNVSRRRILNNMAIDQSVLSQVKGEAYPELTSLGLLLDRIAFFRDSNLGRFAAIRLPQRTDLPEDFLLEDGSNLGLVLNDLQHRPATKKILLDNLKQFYEDLEDVTTKIQGGTVQVFFHERGLRSPVPATRLSDGTLRFLSLLTILCHPDPPPLICIEEPELGLHPDIMRTVAQLLIEASQRTQLIVTTHSETLVSALSGVPESVVVCERDLNGSRLERLEPANLRDWLDQHLLGELWAMGEIGGNRW